MTPRPAERKPLKRRLSFARWVWAEARRLRAEKEKAR